MANTFSVREYAELAKDSHGHEIPVGVEPAVATQTIVPSATSQALTAFNENTKFILISGDVPVNWVIDGTAVVDGPGRLPADVFLFMGVASGGKNDAGVRTPLAISVIDDP